MDYTVQINLPDHKLGDQWVGITSIAPVVAGLTQGTLSRVKMWLTKGVEVYKLDTLSGDRDAAIVIDNITTWACHIPQVTSFLPSSGIWNWDMQFTHSGTITPVTLYKGSLVVHDDITK